jgi:hypothetical protein
MLRAEITRQGVLNALAEFDEFGRSAFLERYGFNGARDYFLFHNGKNYDSKAIAAVAHKWASRGNGRALTALELSGGRTDAAKRLRDLGFTVTSPAQNADWSWDEHVLALDLYMTNPISPSNEESAEVAELSGILNQLGERSGVAMTDKFRNANGVYMKMMNFRRLDPTFQAQGKTGLGRGSKGEEEVWDKFAGDRVALRDAANAIKRGLSNEPDEGLGTVSNASNRQRAISPSAFHDAFEQFQTLVAANQKGAPFRNFNEGIAAAWEGYKPRLRDHALAILAPSSWSEETIGSGAILERVVDAIEIQEDRVNLINNLVFWQNRYGHANRDHRTLLEAKSNAPVRRQLEQVLFDLYRSDADESLIFDRLSDLTGAKYPLLAYLFFLKDMDRFTPIQPTGFDQALRALKIDLVD